MNAKIKIVSSLLVTLLLAVLTACSNSNSSSGGDGMGSLTLGITDAPVDEALKVVVEFTGVHLKGQGNDDPVTVIEFEQPKVINLLDLQGSDSEILLQDISLAAGDYQWIRLQVVADGIYTEPEAGDIDDHGVGSYVLQDNGSGPEKIALKVPSGNQSGLKLVSGFTVDDFGQTNFTIDFDLRKAIHDIGEDYYVLRPALRMVETNAAGHIDGFIDPELLQNNNESCFDAEMKLEGAAVYVFEASTAVDDMQSTAGIGPLSTALVTYDGNAYQYALGFLDAGEYILVLTCDAELDDSEDNDEIVFIAEIDQVFVAAGKTTYVDFD